MRGPSIFKGYYNDLERTKEVLDDDGWLHTNDIGEIQQNGSLKIIDRKKNYFKLSQGEFIAPEKVESIYSRAEGISDVFVFGDSL